MNVYKKFLSSRHLTHFEKNVFITIYGLCFKLDLVFSQIKCLYFFVNFDFLIRYNTLIIKEERTTKDTIQFPIYYPNLLLEECSSKFSFKTSSNLLLFSRSKSCQR